MSFIIRWALVVAAVTGAFQGVRAGTLEDIMARGILTCGVAPERPGFAFHGQDGQWVGLDVDTCRAVAAAALGDANKVDFRPLTAKERFTALQSGDIDLLARTTTWTLVRDAALDLTFAGVTFYDGQGFMGPANATR